ncbi:MAG: hypothetical protein AAGC88_13290, partial [Bacteroidota bacterium]
TPQLKPFDSSGKVVPLTTRLARYAAAACLALVIFIGGRLSVSDATANIVENKAPKDLLYIFGGNGVKSDISGDDLKVNFNGQIKLHNVSLFSKRIALGDTSFVLQPYQHYYLKGSQDDPQIYDKERMAGRRTPVPLEGGFSVVRLDLKKSTTINNK